MHTVNLHVVRVPLILASVTLLFLSGCTEAEKEPPLVPVAGRVTLNNNPMSNGLVTFHPDESKGNTSKWTPTGMIEASGQYKLMTGTKEGAPVGWYRVTVNPRGMTGMKETDPSQIPKDPGKLLSKEGVSVNSKFQTPATSGISIEVTANAATGAYDVKVSR